MKWKNAEKKSAFWNLPWLEISSRDRFMNVSATCKVLNDPIYHPRRFISPFKYIFTQQNSLLRVPISLQEMILSLGWTIKVFILNFRFRWAIHLFFQLTLTSLFQISVLRVTLCVHPSVVVDYSHILQHFSVSPCMLYYPYRFSILQYWTFYGQQNEVITPSLIVIVTISDTLTTRWHTAQGMRYCWT